MSVTIWLIDDDEIFHFVTKKQLHQIEPGIHLISFFDAKEALDCLSNVAHSEVQLPDIILLDIHMPLFDGWDFMDAFQDLRFETRITLYVVTVSLFHHQQKRAAQYSSCNGYLNKPVSNELLSGLVIAHQQ